MRSLEKRYFHILERDLDSELKANNQEYFKLEIEKDEPKDVEIRVIVSNDEQRSFLEKVKDEYNISEIYDRTYDIAKQSKLSQHNLDNKLASNLYELLENKKFICYVELEYEYSKFLYYFSFGENKELRKFYSFT